MMLEAPSCRFRKKQGAFGKEVFYWICGRHEPLEAGEEMDSYPEDWTDEETKAEEDPDDPDDPDVKIESVGDSDDPQELDSEDFIVDECTEEEDVKKKIKKNRKLKHMSESEEEVQKSESEEEKPKFKKVKAKKRKVEPETPNSEKEEETTKP